MSTTLPSIIYHYTSFDKLQYILKNGTLRFKESTKSNDKLDTTRLIEILNKLDFSNIGDEENEKIARDFILGLFKREDYSNPYISLVSCFSEKGDSRLLWDAYTMNRPSNIPCIHGEEKYCYDSALKYNGVCIAFDTKNLMKAIASEESKYQGKGYLLPIFYGDENIQSQLEEWIEYTCHEVNRLSKDEDQTQDIIPPILVPMFTRMMEVKLMKCIVLPMLDFKGRIEAFSPFFKHEFWEEEKELRASLCIDSRRDISHIKEMGTAKYYDISITEECIDHVILGPEFSTEDMDYISKQPDYKINLESLHLIKSKGTDVIVSD